MSQVSGSPRRGNHERAEGRQEGAAVAFGLMGMAFAVDVREAEKHWAAIEAAQTASLERATQAMLEEASIATEIAITDREEACR